MKLLNEPTRKVRHATGHGFAISNHIFISADGYHMFLGDTFYVVSEITGVSQKKTIICRAQKNSVFTLRYKYRSNALAKWKQSAHYQLRTMKNLPWYEVSRLDRIEKMFK